MSKKCVRFSHRSRVLIRDLHLSAAERHLGGRSGRHIPRQPVPVTTKRSRFPAHNLKARVLTVALDCFDLGREDKVTTATLSQSQARGIACVLAGMAFLSAQDAIIKWLSGDYPLHQVVLGRAVIAVALTLVMVRLEGGWSLLRSRRLGLHLARGLLLVVANISYFLALAAMPLAEAIAIFFVAPLFITALSVPFLGERVGIRRWLAVVAGLFGVVIMLRPGNGVVDPVALLPVVAAFCYASMQILTRRLGATDKASAMAFYVQLTFVVISGAASLAMGDGRFAGSDQPSLEFLFRAWVWPSQQDAGLIVICGVLIAAAAYLLSQAYRIAEATVVAPFEYVAVPLSALWGVALWGHWPDMTALVGIALIVGAGLLVFAREASLGRLLAARRPLPPER